MKLWLLASLVILSQSVANALDPRNPVTLCERFISLEDKKFCEQKVLEMQPDWYLAGICEHQYEDQSFYDCLSLSNKSDFPLAKLPVCESPSLADEERMNCLKGIAVVSKPLPRGRSKERLPAAAKPKPIAP